jgi:hypothetical protein
MKEKKVFLKRMKGDNWKIGVQSESKTIVWSYSSYSSRVDAQKAAREKYKGQSLKFSMHREE